MQNQILAAITNPALEDFGDVGEAGSAGAGDILIEIGQKIIGLVFPAALLLLMVYLLWGGFDWITSGGDSSKTANARNKIVQAIIGLIVLSATFAILVLIANVLNIPLMGTAVEDLFRSPAPAPRPMAT